MAATIIATVVFAAAFTVAGSTKEETGTPNFVRKASFIIFAVSDAIALVLFFFSILSFLSVFHCRYVEEDFLLLLPHNMAVGSDTLALSVAAIMVVFSATMFIIFKDGMLCVPALVTIMASLPVYKFMQKFLTTSFVLKSLHEEGQYFSLKIMILNNLPSSQYGRGISIQSCFPEIKSVANSSCKSSGEDDASLGIFSDDDLSLKDAFGPATFIIAIMKLPLILPLIFNTLIFNHVIKLNQMPSISAEPNARAVETGDVQRNYFTAFVPLHNAALKGDWEFAREFFILNPQAVCASITRNQETALHITAGARHTIFVQELVNIMKAEDLALPNKVGNTALCFAAISGIKKIAEVMVNKNRRLPSIRGSKGATPLCMAALLGHREMVWYLYSVTEEEYLKEEDRVELLVAVINADLYDVALDLIKHHPELAVARDGRRETALHVLARKHSAFVSGSRLGIWQRCINSFPRFRAILDKKLKHLQALELVKQLWEQVLLLDDYKIGELLRKPSRLLFTAAELGNVEFIKVLIRKYPDLIWKVDDHSRSIFHIVVLHRQENIFNLIHEIGAHKDLIAAYEDENNNNMLHLAGKLAPPNRIKIDTGAALQLRRELHWFKVNNYFSTVKLALHCI
ncbi:uncharacterized protein LOC116105371 [Pistacia vera]|uniref:uncharacterized protein LOC116105371 n=1 Tax=Pistacia vera TaxID=55513 RepID=UPI001262CA88|nr:uncharacterized protein LOC116105371 [Pistacia vera]